MPQNATKKVVDYKLPRYACYLIVQNSDSRKKVIALGQTYFSVKTRQQELIENYDSLDEAAQMTGIKNPIDYAIFQNQGYQGLYGGLGVKEIHKHKVLKKNQKMLDHMGSTELAANQTHYEVRKKSVKQLRNFLENKIKTALCYQYRDGLYTRRYTLITKILYHLRSSLATVTYFRRLLFLYPKLKRRMILWH